MNNSHDTVTQKTPEYKKRPIFELIFNIVIPSVILMKFSGAEDLGATKALLVALYFPISWGLYELMKYRKINYIALLGLISVLLTGGIGLLQLDSQWLAVKEASIPALIALAEACDPPTPPSDSEVWPLPSVLI